MTRSNAMTTFEPLRDASTTGAVGVRRGAGAKLRADHAGQFTSSNQQMQRLLQTRGIQPKLIVNLSGDPFEQEADRVAEQVMRMPEPNVGTPPCIQRICSNCEKELHRKQGRGIEAVGEDVKHPTSGGRPLTDSERDFFEPRFGQGFSQVWLYTDAEASKAARSINASAYTMRNDIVFAEGQYRPGTDSGKRLLAHELAHTIQQGCASESIVQRKIGEGHDLTSPRFAGDLVLEAVFDNERLLKSVDKGPAVWKLQQALVDAGFSLPRFGVDGDFGAETKAAVEAFQRAHGLGIDGVVGPITMGALDAQFSGGPPVPKCMNRATISTEQDPLPIVPAFVPQDIPGAQMFAKLRELREKVNPNIPFAFPIPDKAPLGFTIPLLPVLFTGIPLPPVEVRALDIPGDICKKCVAEWKMGRPDVVSFVARDFVVSELRRWANQDQNPRECPSTGPVGDMKEVRAIISPEVHQLAIQAEQEHFRDAQRAFDLSGGRHLADVGRLTPERTHLKAADQEQCEEKVAAFLDPASLFFGVKPFEILKTKYTVSYMFDFLENFGPSGEVRDKKGGAHEIDARPPADRPIRPNFDLDINPFGCKAFARRFDPSLTKSIPGPSSETVIIDKGRPPRLPWHVL